MSALSALLHKQRMRWHGHGIDRAHELRRRLAYYVAKHDFEVGDYSIGNPVIRLYNKATRLKIGKYCSIAAGTTFILGGNHRTNVVTTSGLDRPAGMGPGERPYTRGDVVIGSDVWIAGNATILSGVEIDDGAVIGAGSVVIDHIPSYAIAFGNPARVIRKRFSGDLIEELLEIRWWDLERKHIEALRPLLLNDDIRAFIDACRSLNASPAAKPKRPRMNGHIMTPPAAAHASSDVQRAQIAALIRDVIPSFSLADFDTAFDRLKIDSFDMLTLRAKLEHSLGILFDDQSWTSAQTPANLLAMIASAKSERPIAAHATSPDEVRSYHLNMPQMALRGLSESWLFKESGDVHWSVITNGLRTPSKQLVDADGNRLYATFTRFQLNSSVPLARYEENESLTLSANTSRYGAGMFFSDMVLQGAGKSAQIKVMSSFSRYGEAGANTSLLKGQPQIPPDCGIRVLTDMPEFGQAYRTQRAAVMTEPLFQCEYELIPFHDINGVGLLYFAAYPMINDICALRYAEPSFATEFSTRARDLFYFANSDPGETLIYRIHRWHADANSIEIEATLSRKSDGVLMAYATTTKERRRG